MALHKLGCPRSVFPDLGSNALDDRHRAKRKTGREGLPNGYSSRNVFAGSILATRSAGTVAATSTIRKRTSTTPASVGAS